MALAAVLPTAPTLGGLLLVAALAAVLSNVLNNLPAALLLLAVLGDAPAPGVVLAALIGVNIGRTSATSVRWPPCSGGGRSTAPARPPGSASSPRSAC
jgi:hypothetical protein